MVQILTGEKGEGKTKKLIDLANENIKTASGNVVFISTSKRHIYEIHHGVRFVETSSFPLSNYRELVGFICGILSQDSDIEMIYLDGLFKIVKKIDNEDLLKLADKLQLLSEAHAVNFTISANILPDDVPKEIKNLIMV